MKHYDDDVCRLCITKGLRYLVKLCVYIIFVMCVYSFYLFVYVSYSYCLLHFCVNKVSYNIILNTTFHTEILIKSLQNSSPRSGL